MAVIDLQRQHVGIQSLSSQLSNYVAAGQGAMLLHTDGYVYCVFARTYIDGVSQRRLYMSRSNDTGLTWSTPIEISSGYWDDDPAIIQLDLGDTGSDIGIVFTRNDTLTRFTCDKDTGYATSPYDPITGTVQYKKWVNVVHTSGGFMILCLARDGINSPYVYEYTNSDFTTNSWSAASKTVFPANGEPMSMRVKRLSNGHFALVGAYRTSLDGRAGTESSGIGMSNLPAGMLRCDVGVFFSSDEGSTWTSAQKLSNYTGTLAFDLVGITSVASVDLEQISDTRIIIGYQEHTTPMFASPDTTLVMTSGMGNMSNVIYLESKNMLLFGGDNTTNGGLFALDIDAQTITRIYSGSTPALWTNDVAVIAVSTDNNKLAIGTITGGVTVLDISDASPLNWTIIKELRTTSTPATLINNITQIHWDGNTVFYFSYGAFSGNHNWGGRYDTGDNSLVTMLGSYQFNQVVYDFVVQSGKIVIVTTGRIEAIDKSSGAVLYTTLLSDTYTDLLYDSVNDEYIALHTSDLLLRLQDTGSAFSTLEALNATTTPAWTGMDSSYGKAEIPGKGFFIFSDNRLVWYSYASRRPSGGREGNYYLGLGENINSTSFRRGCSIQDDTWVVFPRSQQLILQNLVNIGRIRYAFFEYDSGSKQLITTGVDFYDVCNSIKVGTNLKTLQFPRFCRDADDRLYWYFSRWDINQPGGNELAPVIGIVEPDTVKLTAMARIKQIYTKTFTGQGRIKQNYVSNLDARMRIVFAQCIKAQARIVPRQERTLTMQAQIKNWKSTSCRVSFSVQREGKVRKLRLNFWVNTGYTRSSSLTAQACIAQTYTWRVTGHFLVRVQASNANLAFSVNDTAHQTLNIRARIMKW
jgi:hypothetical protein